MSRCSDGRARSSFHVLDEEGKEKKKKAIKWKVSQPKASPRSSSPLLYSLGLACAFSGVEKYISCEEFNRQPGAQRNLQGGLGGAGVGRRRAGEGGHALPC
uniref:Uncharacterized protein n=1 Tax=Ursus maritimus TaxID=29073 RepID=A0A452UWZ7_URSMA